MVKYFKKKITQLVSYYLKIFFILKDILGIKIWRIIIDLEENIVRYYLIFLDIIILLQIKRYMEILLYTRYIVR